jgi:hypothetical protein
MRQKLINRFNQDPDRFPFTEQFQELMIGKLTGDLKRKDIRRLYKGKFKRAVDSIKVNHKDLLLLSTEVEPEIYILAQETAKKVTGKYISMEELLHLLLITFIKTYEKEPFKKIPFTHAHKGARFKALQRFDAKFSRYYGNIVKSWVDGQYS